MVGSIAAPTAPSAGPNLVSSLPNCLKLILSLATACKESTNLCPAPPPMVFNAIAKSLPSNPEEISTKSPANCGKNPATSAILFSNSPAPSALALAIILWNCALFLKSCD